MERKEENRSFHARWHDLELGVASDHEIHDTIPSNYSVALGILSSNQLHPTTGSPSVKIVASRLTQTCQ